jgi:hypothetical protein
MENKAILTSRPNRRPGVRMKMDQYTRLSDFIVTAIDQHSEIRLDQLLEIAQSKFIPEFPADEIGWYILQVKLDLEAKGIIEQKITQHYPRKTTIVRKSVMPDRKVLPYYNLRSPNGLG